MALALEDEDGRWMMGGGGWRWVAVVAGGLNYM